MLFLKEKIFKNQSDLKQSMDLEEAAPIKDIFFHLPKIFHEKTASNIHAEVTHDNRLEV